MTGFLSWDKKTDAVLLIREADTIASALRDTLAEATPAERPGLRRALALAEAAAAVPEAALRAGWVRTRLAAVEFTEDIASIAALKALRQAEPRLSLLAATQLQKDAVAHPA
ncbi:hypothetical protein [Streptomyces sp. NBC_01268]|uniref:hypothetical protein n=1 Tax=Streptomyces sp. NBC_01268 TaxID=2903806 RepID=UPI002E37390B|nr:hypothetical protein [Streptomyces sp. NBC_01268]